MASIVVPGLDLAPSVPSRIVTVDVIDMTEGLPAAGAKIDFILPQDLHARSDGKVLKAGTTTLELDANGHGEIRVPAYSAATRPDDWVLLVKKHWAPYPYPIRVPAGATKISLASLEPPVEVNDLMAQYLLTDASITITEGAQWGATVDTSGGIASFALTAPPGGTAWFRGALDGIDPDSLTGSADRGVYFALNATATLLHPKLPVTEEGWLTVLQGASNFATQEYATSTPERTFSRSYSSTGWGAWVETTPPPLDILVQTTDDRMMQPAGPLDAFSEVITDREGHIVAGIQSDGAVYIHNLVTDSVGVGENVLAVAAFGDSMVAGQSGGGLSFSGFLETALGYPVFHGGWGGQTSTEIGFRAGGVEIWARIPSGSIAASGATVLEITLPGGMWRPDSTQFDVIAHLEDGTRIPGTLRKSTTQEWTFTPTGLSSAKPVPREVKFVSVQALENAQRGYIFRAGRNNINLETIVRDYRLVRDWVYSAQPQARFLALPLYNDSSNTVGSVPYNTVMEINEALAEVCGRDYYDLRRWVIQYGLSAAGITPTPQDLTDMENDVIPVSLRFDPVHPNAAGREVEAKQVAAVIKSRGWFD